MKSNKPVAVYFMTVTAVAFASIIVFAVAVGLALSLYSGATGARVSAGAFFLQAEDFAWIAAIAAMVGMIAMIFRRLR